MEYQNFGNDVIVRLDPGEEVCTQLLEAAKRDGITLAQVSGIGAVTHVTAGVFNPITKEYRANEFDGIFEVVSLIGTLTVMNEKPYLHAHIAIADGKGCVFGGHLTKAIVSATAEIVLRRVDGHLARRHSEKVGLNLFDFDAK